MFCNNNYIQLCCFRRYLAFVKNVGIDNLEKIGYIKREIESKVRTCCIAKHFCSRLTLRYCSALRFCNVAVMLVRSVCVSVWCLAKRARAANGVSC